MTTPDDTTPTTETTNRSTTTTADPTGTATDPTRTGQTPTDTSRRSIPGRTPITEEAGAPLVPPIQTPDDRQTEPAAGSFDTTRRPTPPPTDDERDAPLVPDLRPTCPPRTDGGSE